VPTAWRCAWRRPTATGTRCPAPSAAPESRAYFAPLAAEARGLDASRSVGFVNVMLSPADKDVVADLFDVVMLNRYYGWYVDTGDLPAAERALEAELNAWDDKLGKPIIITEYGADTLAGWAAQRPAGALERGVPSRVAGDAPPLATEC
jgi:glycosyl hydrolase family 2